MTKKSKASQQIDSETTTARVIAAASKLRDRVDELDFGPKVPWVYNPPSTTLGNLTSNI